MLTRAPSHLSRSSMHAALLSLVVMGIGVAVATADEVARQPGPATPDEKWEIEIRPSEYSAAATGRQGATAQAAEPYAPAAAASGALVPLMSYQQAYRAVPFNREEYEANPGYRHDSAMELMFGAFRPTTIIKQNIPYFSRYPDFFRNRFQIFPYQNSGGQQSLNMYWLWSTNAITW